MFALVESGTITRYLNGNKGITLGDTQYPRSIFNLWTEAERNAIGIYTIVYDDTNKRNTQWYTNTDQSFAFANNTVTATYGSATAKAHADTLYTAQNETDGLGTEGEVAVKGLKSNLITIIKNEAAHELTRTDWYITRKSEKNTAIPSAITTHRNAVRTKQASMCTAITNASDTPALETLYTVVENEDGTFARPLGIIPTLEY